MKTYYIWKSPKGKLYGEHSDIRRYLETPYFLQTYTMSETELRHTLYKKGWKIVKVKLIEVKK